MIDVVQALRATAALNPSYRDFAMLMATAADEIDRLRAENEALRSCACADCNREVLELRDRIAELEAAINAGYITECVLKPRNDLAEPMFIKGIPHLNRYAIVPREEYEEQAQRIAELEAALNNSQTRMSGAAKQIARLRQMTPEEAAKARLCERCGVPYRDRKESDCCHMGRCYGRHIWPRKSQ